MKAKKPSISVKVESKLVRNMTEDEVKSCRSLRIRESSRIAGDLAESLRRPRCNSRVVLIKNRASKILSWGLIDRTEDFRHPTVQLYTRHGYRRRGLGSMVIKEVKRSLGTNKFRFFPHDDQSEAFFKATKCNQLEYSPW